jgi:hypothetical protein
MERRWPASGLSTGSSTLQVSKVLHRVFVTHSFVNLSNRPKALTPVNEQYLGDIEELRLRQLFVDRSQSIVLRRSLSLTVGKFLRHASEIRKQPGIAGVSQRNKLGKQEPFDMPNI